MNYYIDNDGDVYGYDDDQIVDGVVRQDLRPMTDAEVYAHTHKLSDQQSSVDLVATPRQIRQALNACGMRKTVEDGIAAAGQDIKDWWEFSTSFERSHPVITGTAASLGISSSQLDDLFALAVTL
jgi:hypothetical protein